MEDWMKYDGRKPEPPYDHEPARSVETLAAALEAVEWVRLHDWEFCPWCKVVRSQRPEAGEDPSTWEPRPHASDCLRQLALAELTP